MRSISNGREYTYNSPGVLHSQEYQNDALRSAIERHIWKSPARALDYGSGNGWVTNWLANLNFDASGCDISESGIEIARKHYPELHFSSDVSTEALLRRGPFDLVTCVEVIAHCFDADAVLEKLNAVLAPGGILILSTPYHGYWKLLAMALTGRLEQHLDTEWAGAYVHYFTPRSITKRLLRAGFEDLCIETVGRISPFAKVMIVTCRKPLGK